jgi:hypothetical protein
MFNERTFNIYHVVIPVSSKIHKSFSYRMFHFCSAIRIVPNALYKSEYSDYYE